MTNNNQTEKICFRYDGSDEAKQALKWVNEKFKSDFSYVDGHHFTNMGFYIWGEGDLATHRLVTPAEFLRLVSGEPEWTPKYGEEVEVSDNLINWHKHTYIGKNPHNSALPYVIANVEGTIMPYKHIRPVRKSVRDEIEYILSCRTVRETQIDEIMSLIKQRKDEL